MFRENQQIGLYTLIRPLGRGGFGEVWLAERRAKFVTTKVAVKLPLDEQVDHEAIKHEATLWEQASGHPNILPIIDADEYDGQIVIVSEYAPDGSLEEWLKKHSAMPVERAIETTIQILDGLEFLHSRNIIHRDLKPANILLQGTTPRLADFGISRALRTTVASQSQNISGTFAYMSPEALDGKRSVQTDVWSVGVNLYQFLTGTLPFPQKEPSVLFPAIIMREFAPLPDSTPQSLKNVIAKALAKLPENRYKTAGEMREDLRRILRGEKVPNFIQFDLPETQHSLPVNRSLPTQKSPVVSNRNPNKEVETVVRSRIKSTFKQDNPSQKSNSWILAIILSILIGAIVSGIYFYPIQPKPNDFNESKVAQITPTQQVKLTAADYIKSAENHLDNKRYVEAKNDYDKAIELEPENAKAYNGRGNVHHEQRFEERAIADYTRAIQLNPNEANYYYNRGASYEIQDKLNLAITDYNEAIKLNPKSAESYLNRGIALDRQGNHDSAKIDFRKAIELDPKNSNAYNNLGIVYGNQGNYKLAIENYNKAIQLDSQNADAFHGRARLYGRQQKYSLAVADLSSVIKLNPKDHEAYSLRAWTYCTLGKKQLALADEKQAIALGGFILETCQ